MKLSYPFFHADRIKTPTLFLGGDKDFNVPLVGGEQMYQALRTPRRADTELVIYPGQFHGITTPTYKKDRYERYLGVVRQVPEARPHGRQPIRRAPRRGGQVRTGSRESLTTSLDQLAAGSAKSVGCRDRRSAYQSVVIPWPPPPDP